MNQIDSRTVKLPLPVRVAPLACRKHDEFSRNHARRCRQRALSIAVALAMGSTFAFGAAANAAAVVQLSDLDGVTGFRVDGAADGDRSSFSVASAGDINGDGFGDLIVSTPFVSPNGNASGSSYVVFGHPGIYPASFDLSNLDGENGFRLDGAAEFDSSGVSVNAAGDVNGDGLDDLVIGAPFASPNGFPAGSGSVYVIFGSVDAFPAVLELASMDGGNGFRIDGDVGQNNSGYSVSTAGDVNGDGLDDVLIGANYFPGPDDSSGAAYVVFGKNVGFTATVTLGSLDGTDGFRVDASAVGDQTGRSVSAAGDVNGDGFDDVIVGAPAADPNGPQSGSAYVVFGHAETFPASLQTIDLDGSNGFRINGATEISRAGSSVSGAGDINGDGFDDLIIGAPGAGADYDESGRTYVVFGQGGSFSAAFELNALDGGNGFRLDGTVTGDKSGSWVSNAGDVNGDGFSDVVIGAPFADPNGDDSGSSYVVYGHAGPFFAASQLSDLDGVNGFRLDGSETDIHGDGGSGSAVSTAGDVNGDGLDDLLIAAPGSDWNGVDAGSSYVVFGSGPDQVFCDGFDGGGCTSP